MNWIYVELNTVLVWWHNVGYNLQRHTFYPRRVRQRCKLRHIKHTVGYNENNISVIERSYFNLLKLLVRENKSFTRDIKWLCRRNNVITISSLQNNSYNTRNVQNRIPEQNRSLPKKGRKGKRNHITINKKSIQTF